MTDTLLLHAECGGTIHQIGQNVICRKCLWNMGVEVQACPQCGNPMGAIKGSRDAVCRRCGWKDGCC